MKNVLRIIGIIAAVAVIGFSLAACDNGVGTPPGTLTVTGNIPGHSMGATVYNNVTGELTMLSIQSALANPRAASLDSSSPFSLQAFPGGGTFTQSGTFMVTFPTVGDFWVIRNVQFANGSATIRADDLVRVSSLPVGN